MIALRIECTHIYKDYFILCDSNDDGDIQLMDTDGYGDTIRVRDFSLTPRKGYLASPINSNTGYLSIEIV